MGPAEAEALSTELVAAGSGAVLAGALVTGMPVAMELPNYS